MGVTRVEVESPTTRCHNLNNPGCYNNYYDGTDRKGRLKVKSSESPLQVLKETGAVTSIINRYIAQQGVALAGLVAMKGGDNNKLWLLFISLWGNATRLGSVTSRVAYREGVSTKRIDPRTAVKNHKPQLFTNSTGCVKIYGAPLAQYLDRTSCTIDYTGFMTAARVVGIVSAAAHKQGKIELWFATGPDALYPTNPVTWTVHDADTYIGCCIDLSAKTDALFKNVFDVAITSVQVADPGSGEIAALEIVGSAVEDAVRAPRGLAYELAPALYTWTSATVRDALNMAVGSAAIRKPDNQNKVRMGDEARVARGWNFDKVVRMVESRVHPDMVAISVFIVLLEQQVGKNMSDAILTARGAALGEAVLARRMRLGWG